MATLTQPATALLLAILLLGASCAALFPRATSPEDMTKAEASHKLADDMASGLTRNSGTSQPAANAETDTSDDDEYRQDEAA
jgi:hypothetical protein